MEFDLFISFLPVHFNHLALSALYSIETGSFMEYAVCQISILNESCGDSEPNTAGTGPYSYIMGIEKLEHCVIG